MKPTLKITFGLLAFSCLAINSCTTNKLSKSYNQGINVIPVPIELVRTDTTVFTLTANTIVSVSSEDLTNPAAYLVSKVAQSTGYALSISDVVPQSNYISIELNPRIAIGDEGYTLKSTPQGVTIQSRTPQGAFYGVQTLLQLLPAEIESHEVIKYINWTLPSVTIVDEPRFKYRGLMLDVARHFVDIEFIKKQLDVLAMFKINRFHWHLTEDQGWRIEIKKYPLLTEMGGVRTEGNGKVYGPFFYTQEQIKEVVAYASERYIDVIPEIELPGHALAALTGYPELSCTGGPFKQPRIVWGVEEDVYCVGKESTFEFLQDVIDEVIPLFPSQYFHIGGDECPKSRWKKCNDCQARIKALGIKSDRKHSAEEYLQSYTINRIEKYLSSKGKKLIGWDEILEGGLSPTSTIMSWRGESGGIAAAKAGNDVIMTPNSEGMYIDHYQGAVSVEPTQIGGYAPLEKTYSYNPMPSSLSSDKQHHILGAQANMWTEYALDGELMEYMIYPRIIAVAEFTWSIDERKDWVSFQERLNNAMVRMDMHGINYHIPLPEGVLVENVVFTGDADTLTFTNTRNLPMVYTTDGSEPKSTSTLYTDPIVVQSKGSIKISTLLPSEKLSSTRTISHQYQALSPAIIKETFSALPDNVKVSPKNVKLSKGQRPGIGAILRVSNGLYANEADYEHARFGQDTVVTKHFDATLWDYNKPSLAIIEGYIEFLEDGVYTFVSDMDEVWIDGERVIHSPSLSRHGKHRAQKALAKGKHHYKIVFNNMVRDGWPTSWNHIGFKYLTPSGEWFYSDGDKNGKNYSLTY